MVAKVVVELHAKVGTLDGTTIVVNVSESSLHAGFPLESVFHTLLACPEPDVTYPSWVLVLAFHVLEFGLAGILTTSSVPLIVPIVVEVLHARVGVVDGTETVVNVSASSRHAGFPLESVFHTLFALPDPEAT